MKFMTWERGNINIKYGNHTAVLKEGKTLLFTLLLNVLFPEHRVAKAVHSCKTTVLLSFKDSGASKPPS